jgi:hypothetical protein
MLRPVTLMSAEKVLDEDCNDCFVYERSSAPNFHNDESDEDRDLTACDKSYWVRLHYPKLLYALFAYEQRIARSSILLSTKLPNAEVPTRLRGYSIAMTRALCRMAERGPVVLSCHERLQWFRAPWTPAIFA